jgi:hypothetical protein
MFEVVIKSCVFRGHRKPATGERQFRACLKQTPKDNFTIGLEETRFGEWRANRRLKTQPAWKWRQGGDDHARNLPLKVSLFLIDSNKSLILWLSIIWRVAAFIKAYFWLQQNLLGVSYSLSISSFACIRSLMLFRTNFQLWEPTLWIVILETFG